MAACFTRRDLAPSGTSLQWADPWAKPGFRRFRAPIVKPVEDTPAPGPPELESPRGRVRRVQERVQRLATRAEAERERHSSVDVVFTVVDRDIEVGGGILAGALAYRLFIWLLPFALVLVGALGVAADAASESPRHAARSLGLAGLVSQSVAGAARSSGRWYALLIGVPILLWTTRSLLRALIVAHRLVWSDVRERAPKPTPRATLRLLALLVVLFAVMPVTKALWPLGGDVVAAIVDGLLYALLWMLLSIQLPHRDTTWRTLLPGAVFLAVGALFLGLFTTYVLGRYAASKQGTYGALGVAAALLLGLFLISRLVVASAVVNATLWERRRS